jgi:hypothetical protein
MFAYTKPDKKYICLKQLLAFREQLIRQKTAILNSMKEFALAGGETSQFIKKEMDSLLKTLEKKILSLDEKMLAVIHSDDELKQKFSLATSVHGIGKQTALFIMVYTNGFTLFDDWKNLLVTVA